VAASIAIIVGLVATAFLAASPRPLPDGVAMPVAAALHVAPPECHESNLCGRAD
jgi:hypothetical protein